MIEDYQLINNKERNQYEFHIERYTPKIEYIINNQKDIFLTHTEVHPALGGRGIATQLIAKVLEDIKAGSFALVPLCPFVVAYIKKHPEWMSIVKEGIKIK